MLPWRVLGTHLIAELFDCNELHLNDVKKVEEVMMAAAELSSADDYKALLPQFSPYGISV